jgi:hypothetical protein
MASAAQQAGATIKTTFAQFRPALTEAGEAVNLVGGQLKNEFTAAAKVLADTMAAELKPSVAAASQGMIEMIAAAQGVSTAEAAAQVATKALASDMSQMASEVGSLASQVGGKMGAELQAGLKVASAAFGQTLSPAVAAAKDRVIEMIMQLKGLTRAQAEAQVAAQGLADQSGRAGSSAGGVGAAAQQAGIQISGFTVASVLSGISLAGFVRSGVGASAQGELLNLQFARLSASIAGLFRPEIQAVTDAVRNLTNWFNSLSNETRAQIATWLQVGAATLAFSLVLPWVISGIGGVAMAMRALFATIATGMTVTVPWLQIISFALAAILGLAVGTKQGRQAMADLGTALAPVGVAFGKIMTALAPVMESLGTAFKSVMTALVPVIARLAEAMVEVINAVIGVAVAFAPLAEIIGSLVLTSLITSLEVLALTLERVLVPLIKVVDWLTKLKSFGFFGPFDLIPGKQTEPGKEAKKSKEADRSAFGMQPVGAMAAEQVYEEIMKKTIALGGEDREEVKIDYLKKMYESMEQIRTGHGFVPVVP